MCFIIVMPEDGGQSLHHVKGKLGEITEAVEAEILNMLARMDKPNNMNPIPPA